MNKRNLSLLSFAGAILLMALAYFLGGDFLALKQRPIPFEGHPTKSSSSSQATAGRLTQTSAVKNCEDLLQLQERDLLKQLQQARAHEHFRNRHLEFEGTIYRLRSFYDDAPEGEQLTYLVYEEDEDEFATIIERQVLKKGVRYQELEAKLDMELAHILYDESGLSVTHPDQGELFYHFKDGELIGVQGFFNGAHLECLNQ